MQFVTAFVGALFIFVAVVILSLIVGGFLPPALQRVITIPLGVFEIWGTPATLVGVALATVAAVHSFRSTLKRYAAKREQVVSE